MEDRQDQVHDDTILDRGREILRAEGEAVLAVADAIDGGCCQAVRLVEACTGSVVVTGIGKAGLVARKISATLASTGTPSHFLHPAEAMHGDLGALRGDDVAELQLRLGALGFDAGRVDGIVALGWADIPMLGFLPAAAMMRLSGDTGIMIQ
jgi:hypothetical protein